MVVTRAVNYRDNARELRETAASAPNRVLRDQLTSLAAQYDNLVANLEWTLAHASAAAMARGDKVIRGLVRHRARG